MHSKLYSPENYFNLLESWNAGLISIIQLFYGVVCLTLKDKKARSRATWAKAGRRCKGGNKSGRAKVENRGFWTFASEDCRRVTVWLI